MRYDVVVCGGGPAGVVAATQAARAGSRTLLVEKSSRLGGTTVNSGINCPGLFHAWGRQIIAGIGWELVKRGVDEGPFTMPDFGDADAPFYMHQPFVDPMVYASACDEAVMSAGADLLLHTMVAAVAQSDVGWQLTICTRTGLQEVRTRQVVDCTGDASVVTAAGFPLRVPAERQPATLDFEMDGYELEGLDIDALNQAFRRAVANGELKASDGTWRIDKSDLTPFLQAGGRNANHVAVSGYDGADFERTALEVEGRQSVYRMIRFLRGQPGFEHLRVLRVSPEIGVRETATIYGKATVTIDDYRSGRTWPDAIAYSCYPVDIHGLDSASWKLEPLEKGTIATIPMRAMLPAGSINLIVAGRSMSSDRDANSALRVQAACMAMGQAAGVMAHLAASQSCDPEVVSMEELRDVLRQHGAIVPPDPPRA